MGMFSPDDNGWVKDPLCAKDVEELTSNLIEYLNLAKIRIVQVGGSVSKQQYESIKLHMKSLKQDLKKIRL